jgi:hypothetical protein
VQAGIGAADRGYNVSDQAFIKLSPHRGHKEEP